MAISCCISELSVLYNHKHNITACMGLLTVVFTSDQSLRIFSHKMGVGNGLFTENGGDCLCVPFYQDQASHTGRTEVRLPAASAPNKATK